MECRYFTKRLCFIKRPVYAIWLRHISLFLAWTIVIPKLQIVRTLSPFPEGANTKFISPMVNNSEYQEELILEQYAGRVKYENNGFMYLELTRKKQTTWIIHGLWSFLCITLLTANKWLILILYLSNSPCQLKRNT